MKKYYTRVCNFYYGDRSVKLIKHNKTLPLNGNKYISFDKIEIITRNSKKIIHIKDLKKLSLYLKKKINKDLKIITQKKKNFLNLNFNKSPNIMGILNLTPDSFSDGGVFNKKNKALKQVMDLHKFGADLIDIGAESTRPGSKSIKSNEEWNRLKNVLKNINNKIILSLDTRKSEIMEKGIISGVKLINDVSGLNYDKQTIKILKRYNIPFVIQHSKGTPETMQKNPNYKDVLLDVYDFFENKIKYIRSQGIKHNKIIIDPGIGFGKNLKHNMNLISNISIFHSLGFPVLLGLSRKKFIKELSGKNDTKGRLGGTVSSSIFAVMQGVHILRTHDVKELIQSIKVFKNLIKI